MILLVAYKLTPNRDYTAFYSALQAAPAETWSHYIDNIWLLKTSETPEDLNARISPYINQGTDTVFIVKIDASDYKGWLPKAAHNWIKANR